MAMNKKEQAELEEAKTIAALRWSSSSHIHKDVLPVSDGVVANGYTINVHTKSVIKQWSLSYRHGNGHVSQKEVSTVSGSQHGISMFSTKLRALHALRYEVEKDFARQLRAIDMQIEQEAIAKAETTQGEKP